MGCEGNCAKGRSREALDLNRDLDNIKAQIIKHNQHLSDRETFVTAEVIVNEKRFLYLRINDTPIDQWFKEQFGLGQEQRRDIRV